MESFLQYTKSKLDSMKVFNKVHVVLGNEACDLDSTISTLVTAFMLHSVKVESDKLVLPVLNVQRRELRLRTEVTFFLEESAISLDLVTCRDEVDLNGLYSQGKLILTLVDQNLLPVSDAHFQSCVVQIIDHHKQEWNAPDSCDLLIDPVGSCCTLVGKLMLKLAPKLVDPQIALLLYGTILLDTVCLSESAKKTTPSDIQIIEKLEAMLPDVTRDEVFTVLQKAKVDISGLTFEELLMKDLKVISENNIAVAISSLPCLLEESLKDPKTEAILQQFASRNHFSVVVILGISIEKSTNVVHRQLGVFSSNPALHKEVVNALRSSAEVDLQLSEKLVNLESVQLFEQENTSASRKVILPLLRQLLNSSQCIAQSGDPSSDLESALKSEHAPTDKQSGVDFSPPEEKFLASINTTNGGVGGPVVLFGISGEPLSSQGSSAQNSCPYTPQNSVMEEASGNDSKHTELLPSFNSRDMVEKIEEKRGRLRGYEKGSTLSSSVPFTPKNSFVESSFDVYEGHPTLDIDSMSSDDFLEKVKKKKASLSGLDEQSPFPREDVIKQSDRLSADRGNDGPDSGCVISSGEPSFDMTKSPQSPGAGDARGPMDAATLAESGSEKEKKTVNHVSHPLQENWSDDRLLDPVDIDLEMATNYQAETVDFPESPQHLKLMHQKTQERERGLKSEFDEGLKKNSQSEDSSLIEDGQSNRKERPSALNTSGNEKRKKVISVNPDILSSDVREDDQKSLSSLSNKSDGDLASPVEDIVTPDDIITPEDLDDSLFERVGSSELIPEFSAAEEYEEERSWKTCVVGGEERKIDMKVIEPYKKVLSHGGYFGPNRHAIIVFSACYLPDRSRRDYDYVMDNLFLYVLTTLDQLVAEDYVLVYLHGATQRSNMPSFGWLKRCYQMIDRRLRKNLKGLYLVHPTFWLKTIVIMTKPFISSKFSRKLRFVSGLQELSDLIPMDHVCIPDKVKQFDEERLLEA